MLKSQTQLRLLSSELSLDRSIEMISEALNDFFKNEQARFADEQFRYEVISYLSSYESWPTYHGQLPKVEYQKISDTDFRILISADFDDVDWKSTSFETFSRELFAFLDFSPYMSVFELIKEETYSEFNDYEQLKTIRYLDQSLYATEDDLKESKFEPKDEDHIFTLDELEKEIEDGYITGYDGSGDLLRLEEDGTWMKSELSMSVDNKIPQYVKDHFTHFIWYNR